jgi:pimeloyl-ACP methyl ester carboxylesterase
VAVDLPGLGMDPTPAAAVSLQSWTTRIVTALDDLGEPAVLVGHSLGGAAITAAAEEVPNQISKLVYLCAFLPRDGESVADLAQAHDLGTHSALRTVISDDGLTASVAEDCVVPAFYDDCSITDVLYARQLLRPVPLLPGQTRLQLTAQRAARVPKVYIECTRDRGLPVHIQRAMAAATPCSESFSLPSSHSPFFSMPEALAAILGRC